jgi:hypothetical protein
MQLQRLNLATTGTFFLSSGSGSDSVSVRAIGSFSSVCHVTSMPATPWWRALPTTKQDTWEHLCCIREEVGEERDHPTPSSSSAFPSPARFLHRNYPSSGYVTVIDNNNLRNLITSKPLAAPPVYSPVPTDSSTAPKDRLQRATTMPGRWPRHCRQKQRCLLKRSQNGMLRSKPPLLAYSLEHLRPSNHLSKLLKAPVGKIPISI